MCAILTQILFYADFFNIDKINILRRPLLSNG